MQVAGGGGGANFYSGECVYANAYESRAQPLQIGCSVRVTRCLRAPVPARISLGGSKLVQPQRFSFVLSNDKAIVVHVAQAALRLIQVLRCSELIQRNRLGYILRKASFTTPIQPAERVLPVSAALP